MINNVGKSGGAGGERGGGAGGGSGCECVCYAVRRGAAAADLSSSLQAAHLSSSQHARPAGESSPSMQRSGGPGKTHKPLGKLHYMAALHQFLYMHFLHKFVYLSLFLFVTCIDKIMTSMFFIS